MTDDRLLILGGTDLTVRVARAAHAAGVRLAGIVGVGESFAISYSREPVRNARAADVAACAAEVGAPYLPFASYDEVAAWMEPARPAACLAVGWYHMVPARFRALFDRGCLGLHASLLPDLRGGAPLNWAILTGRAETGVTLFEMGDGVDDGPIYGQERFPVGPRAAIADLVEASALACERLVRQSLPALLAGSLQPRPQSGAPCWALQRTPEDGAIDWMQGAPTIDRLIRATGRPYPGAFTRLDDQLIRIWRADVAPAALTVFGQPGQIARLPHLAGPCVVTGDGCLVVEQATFEDGADALPHLIRSGNRRLAAKA
jgi:methionyl-tRNA formyltransferase